MATSNPTTDITSSPRIQLPMTDEQAFLCASMAQQQIEKGYDPYNVWLDIYNYASPPAPYSFTAQEISMLLTVFVEEKIRTGSTGYDALIACLAGGAATHYINIDLTGTLTGLTEVDYEITSLNLSDTPAVTSGFASFSYGPVQNGIYTVTPSAAGKTFTPHSQTFIVGNVDTTITFAIS